MLWTTTTMLNGPQFTSKICWLYLETCCEDISFSWMDISPSFQKTDRQFSLGLDLFHEQNNAVIKGMRGATLSLNKFDESSLARWGLCIDELASIVGDYEFEGNNMNNPHVTMKTL